MSLNLNSNMTVADCGQLSFSAKNTKKVLISDQKATRKQFARTGGRHCGTYSSQPLYFQKRDCSTV